MKLHLGCYNLIKEGWLNLDIQKPVNHPDLMQWDLRNGLPDKCKNVSLVYHSHFLEHLLWKDGLKLLRECHERMVPGGVMRMCLPDFRNLVRRYLDRDWNFFSHCASVAPHGQLMEIINYSLYQRDDGINAEHLTMYDAEYAIFTLEQAGFKNCREVPCDNSIDYEFRSPYSFFVVGEK